MILKSMLQVKATKPQFCPIAMHAPAAVSRPRKSQHPAGSPLTHLAGHLDLLHSNA